MECILLKIKLKGIDSGNMESLQRGNNIYYITNILYLFNLELNTLLQDALGALIKNYKDSEEFLKL